MEPIETRFINANGLSFETDTIGSGDRFALCLHGFPENKYSWRFQLPYLAERGFTVWAPNLRGYGHTSRPQGVEAYRLKHLMADVEGLFAASRAENQYREYVLIAHDWGAYVAWALAMHGSAPLDKLVIMNVPHPALFRKGLRSIRQLRKSWYVFFFQLPWFAEAMFTARNGERIKQVFRGMAVDKTNFSKRDLEVFRSAATEPGAMTAMINYYRANIGAMTQMDTGSRGSPLIETPTLMIWGEEDAALGKELTYGTERYVEDLTIRYLPGVSHWVQQEAPGPVNTMLGAFLDGKPVPELAETKRRSVA